MIDTVCILLLVLLGLPICLPKPQTTDATPTCGVYEMSIFQPFFRTNAQQAFIELNTLSDTRASQERPVKSRKGNNTLFTWFTDKILRFTQEQPIKSDPTGEKYHGCCASKVEYLSPDTAFNTYGKTVKLVQIKDHRQYFKTETCTQMKPCSMGCTCRQDRKEVKAIIYNPDEGFNLPRCVISDIFIQGCCKCLNIG